MLLVLLILLTNHVFSLLLALAWKSSKYITLLHSTDILWEWEKQI